MSVILSCFAGAGAQFFDNNGVPLAGGLLYTYSAGTTTPIATYTSNSGSIANPNPIVLDSSGRVPNEIWLTPSNTYKFILQTAGATQIGSWDNIPGINDFSIFSASNGSSLIGYNEGQSGAITRTVQGRLQDLVSVFDFIPVSLQSAIVAGSSTTDVSSYINSALALGGGIYFPNGVYYVTSTINVTQAHTTIYFNNATLKAPSSGTLSSLLNINQAAQFTTITGQLFLDGQLNPNIYCLLNVNSGFNRIENINLRFGFVGLLIGQASNTFNQVSLSETFYSKIYTNGCCRGVEIWGLFSVGIFTNCLFVGGENSVWTTGSYDVTTVKIYGGRGYFNMCEFNGSASNTYPMFYINQSMYSGSYFTGYLTVTEADIECPRPVLQVWNGSTSNQALNIGNQIITNSRIDVYVSQITGSLAHSYFYTNNYYNGRLIINSNRIYFDDPISTQPVIQGALTVAQINFNDFLANLPYYGPNVVSFAGYPPEMPFQTLAQVHMANAFTAINTAVLFDTINTGINGQPFPLNSAYSTSTGKFTVPTGGLQSVMVTANYTMTGSITAGASAYFVLNSSSRSITNATTFQNVLQTEGSITAMFPEMVAGDTINFVVYTNNAGQSLNVGTQFYNTMTIYGMVANPNA